MRTKRRTGVIIMKHLNEKTIDYMNSVWGLDSAEGFDDINLFWSKGYYELVAKRLVDAGAVEPNCREAKQIIAVAESITAKEEADLINEALEDVTVAQCPECNHTHFYDIDDLNRDGCFGCDNQEAVDYLRFG